MIDWVTAVIPLKHPVIAAGGYYNFDENGEHISTIVKPAKIIGSFDSSIQAKTQALTECRRFGSELYINGNPTKFLQGHNIVGSDNVCELVLGVIEVIASVNGFDVDDFTKSKILRGNFELKRLDINYAFELPSQSDVVAWIKAASVSSRTRHGLPELTKTTVYWGKSSRRWTIKAYSKFAEILSGKKGHILANEFLNSPLVPYIENKVRIELCLRSEELKKIVNHRFLTDKPLAKFFNEKIIKEIFDEYHGKIEMTRNIAVNNEKSLLLSQSVRGSYFNWLHGLEVRDCLSKATFYRHRREIISTLGVDISLPRTSIDDNNVVPMVRELTAVPAQVPDNLLCYIYKRGA